LSGKEDIKFHMSSGFPQMLKDHLSSWEWRGFSPIRGGYLSTSNLKGFAPIRESQLSFYK